MRKALSKCAALLLAMTTIAACPLSAEASTLKTEDGIRYIQYDSGEAKPYTGWTTKAGKRYYYKNGIMKKNCWLTVNGRRKYFLTKDGSAAVGKVTVSGVEYNFDDKGQLIPDEWGITLTASNVTPTGMNIEYLWDGTKTSGEIQFGASYHLEQYKNGKWERIPTVNEDIIAFIAISYSLTESEPVFVQTEEWSRLYGSLESGNFRYCTDILDFRRAGDYDSRIYYAYFKI